MQMVKAMMGLHPQLWEGQRKSLCPVIGGEIRVRPLGVLSKMWEA